MPESNSQPRAESATLTREVALSLPLTSLAACYLHTQCRCRMVTTSIGRMLEARPSLWRGITLGAVIARLRCPKCRQNPSEIMLAEDVHWPGTKVPFGAAEGWSVQVG